MKLFDLIVGTSTGGILAAGLSRAVSKKSGTPKYSAERMLNLYAERGREIFERSFWRGVTSLGGALEEQYSHEPLEKILKEYFGNAKLSDCLVPIVLPSYDIERRKPYFFKTRRAQEDKNRDHYLRDAARATSAAPTFFEPARITSLKKDSTPRVLIDGGVFVNNPTMCAFAEACSMGKAPDELILVSLGTGEANREIPYDDAKDWGAIGWVRPLISVMMDGEADAANYQAGQILPDKSKGAKQRYFRFDTKLDLALDDMDAASASNISSLKAEAQQIIADQSVELVRLRSLLSP